MNQNILQKMVYQALAADQGLDHFVRGRIFDDVPQEEHFPYVVIGEDDARPWGNDCTNGLESLITIHAFSRYAGRMEAKDIGAAIYRVLHNAKLMDNSGVYAAVCTLDTQTTMAEDDGATRHLVIRFRVFLTA